MKSIIKTEAMVLSAMRWQESSKIVHLFSDQEGYIKLLAKGALRPKSDFRGVLESLNHVEVVFVQKASRGLQLLTSASLLNAHLRIREDIHKTAIGMAILELIKKLLPVHEPIPGFFSYVAGILRQLDASDMPQLQGFLWHFLFVLSEVLGFGWQLDECLDGGGAPQRFPVQLDYRRGGVLCSGSHGGERLTLDAAAWNALVRLVHAQPSALETLDHQLLNPLNPALTELLLRHLSHHTEAVLTLNSLKWYV